MVASRSLDLANHMTDRIPFPVRNLLVALATGMAFAGTAALDYNRVVDDLVPAAVLGSLLTVAGALLYPPTRPSGLSWLPVAIVAAFSVLAPLLAYASWTCSVRFPGRCDFNGLMALPMGLLLAGFVARVLNLLDELDAWEAADKAARAA